MGERGEKALGLVCLSGWWRAVAEVREGGESFDEGRLGREARSRAVGRLAQALTQAEKLRISM